MSKNIIEALIDWSSDFHPVTSMRDVYDVAQIARKHGDLEAALLLSGWAEKIATYMEQEFNAPPLEENQKFFGKNFQEFSDGGQ